MINSKFYKLFSDEAFFTCYTPAELKNRLLTRGSGSERKEKVVVMTESEFPDKPKKGGKSNALESVQRRHQTIVRRQLVWL